MIRDILNKKHSSKASKKSNRDFYINLYIIGIMFVIAFVFLWKMPSEIPILHEGSKQIYISSKLGVFLIPIISLITNALFKIQNRLYLFYTYIYIIVLFGMTFYYYSLLK